MSSRLGHWSLWRASTALLAAILTNPATATDGNVQEGRGLYLAGESSEGRSLTARVQGDVPVAGAAAACANCHRPSGLGSSEGGKRALPLTGSALFAPRTTAPARPRYDDQTLVRAIRTGMAADGRRLDDLMPRYALDDRDALHLVTYLRQLGTEPPPGVSASELVVATILASDASAVSLSAVRKVIERYVEVKNQGSRGEDRRAAAARRHPLGDRRDRAFRRWRLVEWTLNGDPSTWEAQLEHYYQADPPFVVMSGAAGAGWPTIGRFCERQQLPCVLPVTDNPPSSDAGRYSLYLHAGASLEGQVTARHLAGQRSGAMADVLVVRREGATSTSAWDAFLTTWTSLGGKAPRQIVVPANQTVDAAFWQDALSGVRPTTLVTWLATRDLANLPRALGSTRNVDVYTSQSFTAWAGDQVMALLLPQLWHVYPYRITGNEQRSFAREAAWLKAQNLTDLHLQDAGRALFACHVVGEQLAAIENNFSRDYFLEGLEHMLDGSNMTSMLPRTTLAAGQRYLSRGAYVLPMTGLASGTSAGARWIEQ